MAFTTSKVNLKQTAVNASATITAAMGADFAVFELMRDDIYMDLLKTHEEEQAETKVTQTFNAAPAGGGAPKGGSWSGGGKGDAGSLDLKFGAFKGLTIEQVWALDGQAAADYGYGSGEKDGKQYVRWLTKNDKNEFMARKAAEFIDGVRV